MNKFLLLLTLSFSLNAAANVVDGTLFYKLKDGSSVERQVTLEVPARGQGEVVLRAGDFEMRTKKFRNYSFAGKDTFTALFKTQWQGKKAILLFKGTYFKSSNKILYYGDFYKKKKHRFIYSGGFRFEYDR